MNPDSRNTTGQLNSSGQQVCTDSDSAGCKKNPYVLFIDTETFKVPWESLLEESPGLCAFFLDNQRNVKRLFLSY